MYNYNNISTIYNKDILQKKIKAFNFLEYIYIYLSQKRYANNNHNKQINYISTIFFFLD